MKNIKTFDIGQLAQTLYNAQDFVDGWTEPTKSDQLQVASYIVACFFAKELGDGVEWDVVHDELCEPLKSTEEWKKVLTQKFRELQECYEEL